MHTHITLDTPIPYDGRQLASHWIYRTFGLRGDALVAFAGPCQVDLAHMVDLEDVQAQAPIFSPHMLHIIAEFFQGDLHLTVYRQRLLIIIAGEMLASALDQPVHRRGDDLYLDRADGTPGKRSVSIATTSPTSTLIHAGFNITTSGTPVPTVGLADLGIDVAPFARDLVQRYVDEVQDIWLARCKVRAVGETG